MSSPRRCTAETYCGWARLRRFCPKQRIPCDFMLPWWLIYLMVMMSKWIMWQCLWQRWPLAWGLAYVVIISPSEPCISSDPDFVLLSVRQGCISFCGLKLTSPDSLLVPDYSNELPLHLQSRILNLIATAESYLTGFDWQVQYLQNPDSG